MNDRGIHFFGRPIGVMAVVVYKALWGLSECASGLLLVFSGRLISGELAEDPQDLFVHWLLQGVHFNPSTAAHVGALFLFLGAIKLLVACGVWFSSWRIRRILIIFLCVVVAYATFALATNFSALKLFAWLSDLAILFYLWRALPKHLRRKTIS